MIIFLICAIVLLYCALIKTEVKLFSDNGRRVAPFKVINNDAPCHDYEKCNLNTGCISCVGTCAHFDEDVVTDDGRELARNNPGEGYCMRNFIDDRGSRGCNNKHGGKWVLTRDESNSFYFKCYCTTPTIFDNGPDGDCSLFKGCISGALIDNDGPLNDLHCTCPDDMMEKIVNGLPTCVKKNYYQTRPSGDNDIDKKYVAPEYRKFNLPNPCMFDAFRKYYVPGAGQAVLVDGVAMCKVLDPKYTTVLFEDDYLLNNGGKYANGIARVSDADPDDGIMYESRPVARVGKRYNSKDIIIPLPYLHENSGNRGGTGRFYNFASKIQNYNRSKIYVYAAPEPKIETVNMTRSSFVTYIPTYLSGFEVTNKTYSGTIPVLTAPTTCNAQPMLGPLQQVFGKYPEFDKDRGWYVGKEPWNSSRLIATYAPPSFCISEKGLTERINTRVFTGIYYDDGEFIHNVSPGVYLANLLRQLIKWKIYDIEEYRSITIVPHVLTGSKGAGLTADGFDCDEVANPSQKHTRYKCTDGDIMWNSDL